MKTRMSSIGKRLAVVAAAGTAAVLVGGSPAFAATDNSFSIYTTDRSSTCSVGSGKASFADYGPGMPGGGNNDDYVTIEDLCKDGHGVKAYAWLTRGGTTYYLGSAYDGYGTGVLEVWDPFKAYGNVKAGDYVGLKVCRVDGDNDPTPSYCHEATHRSMDG